MPSSPKAAEEKMQRWLERFGSGFAIPDQPAKGFALDLENLASLLEELKRPAEALRLRQRAQSIKRGR